MGPASGPQVPDYKPMIKSILLPLRPNRKVRRWLHDHNRPASRACQPRTEVLRCPLASRGHAIQWHRSSERCPLIGRKSDDNSRWADHPIVGGRIALKNMIMDNTLKSGIPFFYDKMFSLKWVIVSIIKFMMKLLIHFQTSTVQPLEFGNGQVISSHTLLGV